MIHHLPAAVTQHVEAAEQLATNWWGIVSLLVIFVLGPTASVLVTVWQNGKTRSTVGGVQQTADQTSQNVEKVQNHVANGHPTLLRDDLTEALTMMRLTNEYVRQLPNRDDLRRIEGKVDSLERRFTADGR